jgi:hypothetical protein
MRQYNHDRERHGRITNGRRPTDLVYGLPQDGAETSRTCRHESESV